jgi:two-component system sensor histidine kinase KdpD
VIGGYVVGSATIALITLFYQHEPTFKVTTVVLTYLLAILVASALWGLGVSVFMSVVATLVCDYFFFPPIGEFTVTDPQDYVSLVSFLITSVIGSDLSARARRQAEEANKRRNEVEKLYQFSRHLLDARNPMELLIEIPNRIVESFKVGAAALYLPEKQAIYRSGIDDPHLDAIHLKSTVVREELEAYTGQGTCFVPMRIGTRVIGSYGISSQALPRQTLEAIGALIASAIDRAQAIELAGKAEAARENERLKSVLLDAVTHDFRTPLTSIKGSVTSLLGDVRLNKKQRGELLTVIDEECDRINRLVGEAAEMSRLESGDVKLDLKSHAADELITKALADCENARSARPIRVEREQTDLRVHADLSWAQKVLVHLIENAHLYSSPGQPITISTEKRDDFVVFSIADTGPGIEETEVGQIFDRFYRGKDQRYRVPGTGMGLSISKAIVEAHGGTIECVSQRGHGSVFTFSLRIDRGAPPTFQSDDDSTPE